MATPIRLQGIPPIPVVPYTQNKAIAGRYKDPINLIYGGRLAKLETVLEMTRRLLWLDTEWGVGDQVFLEPEVPVTRHRQDFNQASAMFSGLVGRHHTRIYELHDPHPVFWAPRCVADPSRVVGQVRVQDR